MKNYITLFLRLVQKNRLFVLINLAGLTAGLVCVTLIFMFIRHELSFDKYLPGSDRIYRIAWFNDNPQTRTPHPMAQAMAREFPEVESAVTISPLWGPGLTRQTFEVRNPEKDIQFNEAGILSVDSTFFEVFPFQLIKGNIKTVLRTPRKLLISASTAKRYFGDEDPIGKRLAINRNETVAEIEGVFQDIPDNTHFHFDFLVSYVHMKAYNDPESEYYTWKDFGHFNYVRLKEGASAKKLEDQLMNWVRKYIIIPDEAFKQMMLSQDRFRLQPIEEIHLHSNIRWELEANGNIEYVYILGGAALFILIIACINFVALSTAKSVDRAKEIGVRKTMGAGRQQLYVQFLGEALVLSLSAAALCIVVIELLLPLFNSLTLKNLLLEWSDVLLIFALATIMGLVAGLYPAVRLASLKPQLVLKGKFSTSARGRFVQNTLLVSQFSLSMILICGCFVLVQQIFYLRDKPLGFDKDQVLVIPYNNDLLTSSFNAIKTELQKITGVREVSATSNIPGKQFNQHSIATLSDPNHEIDAAESFVDENLISTLGLKLAAGRFFMKDSKADSANAVIINETTARQLNLTAPIGKQLRLQRDGYSLDRTVVGVVKDFNFQSLHNAIQPLIFLPNQRYNFILVKIDASQPQQVIGAVRNSWQKFYKGFGFEYFFLDETLDKQYQSEQRMSAVLIFFTITGILITCMGLLGQATVKFKAREKEIGVRKVLGSSTLGIQMLLLKDTARLVIVALLIGSPLAYFVIRAWLQNFTYHVPIGGWSFAGAASIVISVTLITISYLVRKTSQLNPTEILKNE